MSTVKTKTQVIEETAAFYNSNNRSVNETGRCLYNGLDGKQCAFARVCTNPSDFMEGSSALNILTTDGFYILKPEYRIENTRFWNDIQTFHDEELKWTETGLSEIGQRRKQRLLENYKD
jgi:hypothetical protein